MVETDELSSFSHRVNEICSDMKLPERGRQGALAKLFGVTQKGARRWLVGEGYPEMQMCVRLAKWAGVQLEWLLTGRGPKYESSMASDRLWVLEALDDMDIERAQATLDFYGYQLQNSSKIIASEKTARYLSMIDTIKKDMSAKAPKSKK